MASLGSFDYSAKAWLANYKKTVLKINEDGVFFHRGKTYKYPYILPAHQKTLNIISEDREEFWSWITGKNIKLHKYFHHLNSSQALCFNLFFPLLKNNGNGLNALLSALNISGTPIHGAMFEFVPNPDEGTNFDFMIPMKNKGRIYFEIKYTEASFAKAKEDQKHVSKFRAIYEPMVVGRFEKSFCSTSQFLKSYQIMRNIWHLREGHEDIVIFLIPKGNTALRREESIVNSCSLEPYKSRIRIVYLEDLIIDLDREIRLANGNKTTYLAQFSRKYFPLNGVAINDSAE